MKRKFVIFLLLLLLISISDVLFSCRPKRDIPIPEKPFVIVEIHPSISTHRFTYSRYVFKDVNGEYFEFLHLINEYEVGDTIK